MIGLGRVGVFHPGTQHSWQTARAFQEEDRLGWYATSVFYDARRWPYRAERLFPGRWGDVVGRELRRRHDPRLDPALVRQFGWWEWAETATRRLHMVRLTERLNVAGNVAFGKAVIGLAQREPVTALWGFDTSSLEVFRWARRNGILCVLDQTGPHAASEARILEAERHKHEDFFIDGHRPLDSRWLERQAEELELADLVIVGSRFTASTLVENGCAPDKIRVVPYGFDEGHFPEARPQRAPLAGRPVHFLFVGAISPDKGMGYLLPAVQELDPARAKLTLVGRLALPEATWRRYSEYVRHVPQVPRSEVARYFAEADCLVFPSLCDGGGIVLYEAVASALGILQSRYCGEGVERGQNGRVLDPLSVSGIVDAMEEVSSDPGMLAAWQDASWQVRPERSWAAYRKNVRAVLA
jgi:glycosyltransferase involved in cell wall biosynthesis